jgi:hypothetical protein
MSSLPGSNALMRGLVLNATDVLYPEMTGETES